MCTWTGRRKAEARLVRLAEHGRQAAAGRDGSRIRWPPGSEGPSADARLRPALGRRLLLVDATPYSRNASRASVQEDLDRNALK